MVSLLRLRSCKGSVCLFGEKLCLSSVIPNSRCNGFAILCNNFLFFYIYINGWLGNDEVPLALSIHLLSDKSLLFFVVTLLVYYWVDCFLKWCRCFFSLGMEESPMAMGIWRQVQAERARSI